MSDIAVGERSAWLGLVSSSVSAVIAGFVSTILLIMEAARAVGANPAQQASWAASLCFGMAITSLILSWRYRMPIITAWSTPGAALIATSAPGVTYENALGAFLIAGVLTCFTALITPLAGLIESIPADIAAAMLAGILLRYSLGVPGAALAMPYIILPLIAAFFALRLSFPLFAVPVIVALESVLVTFLVTASGITLGGIGSAFWGLAAGLILFGPRRLLGR
jgi:benzoate membrane transport protein